MREFSIMKFNIKRDPLAALAVLLATLTSACASMSYDVGDRQFGSCAAYAPAYQVTDDFMRTFNTKDATAWQPVFATRPDAAISARCPGSSGRPYVQAGGWTPP